MKITQNSHGKIESTHFPKVPQGAYLFLGIMMSLENQC